ncbi:MULTISPECIES: hypothetical protein [Elizabethkingia]|uniref:hypothetical protein n=1 Tax=Elizabethkingia TaxID=308865 RepID=UPI000999C6C1|nr:MULTISPECIES: hypothetical protein [Elizabethkingia]AQX90574.1 hypothetical protein AYC67_16815 [Elizabethkingia anophelis]EHM7981715.1 hypothetical protein [Elizabethkingia anophelis]EHM8032213.1 hypothetical protein [Elizabethkingia anophelis]EHZ9535167.1 hypothetical protein [Elizabethkingia anophelis]EKU3673077.1 hypothetical protein [Elizabethkingia anophelis]
MSHKSIQKLHFLIERYLREDIYCIYREWGKPRRYSDASILIYKTRWNLIFQNEIAFVLNEGIVVDITLAEYIFGIARRSVFYYEGQTPEYRIVNIKLSGLYQNR